MVPLRDNIPTRQTPVVNRLIIGINVLLFLYEMTLQFQGQLDAFLGTFAIIPAREVQAFQALVSGNLLAVVPLAIPILSAMFLHGGLAHIFGNMLFLWVFGDNVEDLMGHGRYIVFYLLCGALASVAQIVIDPSSTVPNIGASGAIAGVLGAYLLSYPKAKVEAVLPLGFIFLPFTVPAIFFLVWWFFQQALYSVGSLGMNTGADQGGVAYWAHTGGFVAGFVLVKFFAQRQPPNAVYKSGSNVKDRETTFRR
ncbi:rhomboid family intramembrane serine protease [Leptolyngbya sp. FACHB-261]|uniref:rhomboid family intramembrane serine protease n=1 Tax=Leptolyngbya sp. FACHB-261 TaxID=2692806 RepID=UPI0016831D98|nr:rhomboid family intramembrane serine protease [Leptolyngbya sp. FACHB-261]MBD2101502.1 rhomboid family intramembrane serine protease [Leptolyngbya sp. FACHB-261]